MKSKPVRPTNEVKKKGNVMRKNERN